ncbi:hypothetical protein PI124_g10554 [Phytophthora idaei]|nr:hypothetical protein PI125_g10138 [Phytophthora idaei]KAG3171111.1 hypothetical protein PI126_g2064 [Phytophthora idaei]KAG3244689.1 hypothetical protein PI124_g10554 [Phytophthora idaei]
MRVRVRNDLGEVEIKPADDKACCFTRRELSLLHTFYDFRSKDDILVIEMNYAFDCIMVLLLGLRDTS